MGVGVGRAKRCDISARWLIGLIHRFLFSCCEQKLLTVQVDTHEGWQCQYIGSIATSCVVQLTSAVEAWYLLHFHVQCRLSRETLRSSEGLEA
eukprot:2923735-Amphidinium_carterae.1